MTTLTDYNDQTLAYAYDASGHVTSMTDWHSKTISYAYTDVNQRVPGTPSSRDTLLNSIGKPPALPHKR